MERIHPEEIEVMCSGPKFSYGIDDHGALNCIIREERRGKIPCFWGPVVEDDDNGLGNELADILKNALAPSNPLESKLEVARDGQLDRSYGLGFMAGWNAAQDKDGLKANEQLRTWQIVVEENRPAPVKDDPLEVARQALKELVELKDLKDTRGKTEDYERRQPIAWDAARAALEVIGEDRDATS